MLSIIINGGLNPIVACKLCRSIRCFRLGWPMRADADFFCLTAEELRVENSEV